MLVVRWMAMALLNRRTIFPSSWSRSCPGMAARGHRDSFWLARPCHFVFVRMDLGGTDVGLHLSSGPSRLVATPRLWRRDDCGWRARRRHALWRVPHSG